MAEATKPKWVARFNRSDMIVRDTKTHEHVATVHAVEFGSLIAAAPDLLVALRMVLRATDFEDHEPWIVAAHAAMAKATDTTPVALLKAAEEAVKKVAS